MNREPVGHEARPPDPITQLIFREIQQNVALPEGVSVAVAASTVLCTLLRRVSGGEVRDFVRVTPPTLRALLSPCVAGREEPPETFALATFLRHVADQLHVDTDTAARISRAVFSAAQARVSRKELDDVEAQLPRDLAQLWRNPGATGDELPF